MWSVGMDEGKDEYRSRTSTMGRRDDADAGSFQSEVIVGDCWLVVSLVNVERGRGERIWFRKEELFKNI